MWPNPGTHSTAMDQRIRFEAFELDPTAGELRKSGVKVALSGQPLELLAILTRRPGEVVTREELKEALWPDETFGDFDTGLNSAVRRVRRALDDSPTSPRFVETLPKRGYRFIGQAESLAGSEPSRRKLWFGLAAGVAVALGTLGFLMWPEPESQRLTFTERALTYGPGQEQWPRFSPDGTRVVFDWNGGSGDWNDIYFGYTDGSAGRPVRLTSNPLHEKNPAWSPDGNRIVFARFLEFRRSPQESPFQMVLKSLGGREQVLGDFQVRGQQADFDWSPDGKFIAFHCRLDGPVGLKQVCIYSLETNESWSVAIPTGGRGHVWPRFSPDRRSIVYVDSATKTLNELRLSADKRPRGKPQVLVGGFGSNPIPTGWSVDGKLLYFRGVSAKGESGLWAVEKSTGASPVLVRAGRDLSQCTLWQGPSGKTRLACAEEVRDSAIIQVDLTQAPLDPTPLIDATGLDANPQFSRDGTRISFLSDRTEKDAVWTSNADGSNARLVTEFRYFSFDTPRWSPDGRRIMLDAAHDRYEREVYVIDIAAGKPGPSLTHGTGRWPSWVLDGKSVYFIRSDSEAIWKLNIDTLERTKILDGYGTGAVAESHDHKSLYFIHADSLMSVPLDKGHAATGEPDAIARRVRSFGVVEGAVYFIDWQGAISRYDETSGVTSLVIKTDAQPQPYEETNGISVSPDERWLLYTKNQPPRWDLKLLESVE